jgi:lipooligosaccharide transport system ATP-binding protein
MELQRICRTQALQIRPGNLEDVYLKLTGRELDDNE